MPPASQPALELAYHTFNNYIGLPRARSPHEYLLTQACNNDDNNNTNKNDYDKMTSKTTTTIETLLAHLLEYLL